MTNTKPTTQPSQEQPMTMVEKVARALFQVEWLGNGSEAQYTTMRAYWENSARAAIAAMREPEGTGLIGAGGVAMFKADLLAANPREATVAIWQAMIDESLR